MRYKIGWARLYWKGNLPFLLCCTLYSRANFKQKTPGGLYAEGRLNGGFFALRFWGAYIWRGLYTHVGAYFRNFTVHCPVQDKTLNFITLFRTKDS